MPVVYLLRGVALGLSIAAPVGPIGVLVIRRTLANGYLAGVASGMGAATADMLYGAVAAFGLTAISGFLLGERLWIHLIGALFLGYLGVRTLLARPAPSARESAASAPVSRAMAAPAPDHPTALATLAQIVAPGARQWRRDDGAFRLVGAYASTVALTLANPATILSFVAIFAGVGIVSARGGYATAAYTVAGVFCGSALWWLLLCGGVNLARRAFSPRALRWVSALSGAILLGFAVYAVVSVWP